MATKHELAESLTIAELVAIADEHGVDVSDCEVKDDYVDAVADGVSKDVLEAAASDDSPPDGEGTVTKEKGPDVVPEPDPAPEISNEPPAAPPEGSPAADTPSGYALMVADGDPDAYAKARAEKRYG